MDLRNYRGLIVEAMRNENDKDKNWGWHVKRINKEKILIRWGYLDFIGQTGDFSIRLYCDSSDVTLVGCMDDKHGDEWFRDDDADDLFVCIGDRHWHDAKTIEDGLKCMVRRIARLAHARY